MRRKESDERRIRSSRNPLRGGWREPNGTSAHVRDDGRGYPPWGWRDVWEPDGGDSTGMGYGPGGAAYRHPERPDGRTESGPDRLARWSSVAEQSFRGRGPRGYRRSDERILEDVCDRLTEDDEVDASNMTVTVSGGEVTLEGEVDERRIKWLAEEIASRCLGVMEVHNRLRVAGRGGQSAERSHK